MKIAIGCDHIVVDMKNELINHFKNLGHTIIDCGTYSKTRTHYPIYGREVALNVVQKHADVGVVLCGTGIGISNSASKVKNARCVLVTDPISAKKAKEDFDANIISFGGRVIGIGTAIDIVQYFIDAKYLNKNQRLIELLNNKISTLKNDKNLYKEILIKWNNGFYTDGLKQDQVDLPLNKIILSGKQ